MSDLYLILFSLFAGFMGALLGLGGGVLMVPFLSLLCGLDIKIAIGVSLFCVLATSLAGSYRNISKKLVHFPISQWLEVSAVLGSIIGMIIYAWVNSKQLFLIFGFFLLLMSMTRNKKKQANTAEDLSDWHSFKLTRASLIQPKPLLAFGLMTLAGVLSSLLGIGSGVIKVLALEKVLRFSPKVSTATSNYLMGMTAVSGAIAFYYVQRPDPRVFVAPLIGILLGAPLGAMVMQRIPEIWLQRLFQVTLLLLSSQMIWKGLS